MLLLLIRVIVFIVGIVFAGLAAQRAQVVLQQTLRVKRMSENASHQHRGIYYAEYYGLGRRVAYWRKKGKRKIQKKYYKLGKL